MFSQHPGAEEVARPRVVNVILPEPRGHFLQQVGFILATFFLLAFIVTAVIVLTRRRRKRGTVCEWPLSSLSYVLASLEDMISSIPYYNQQNMFLYVRTSLCVHVLRVCVLRVIQGLEYDLRRSER